MYEYLTCFMSKNCRKTVLFYLFLRWLTTYFKHLNPKKKPNKSSITELEVVVGGTDVVAGAQQAFHHQTHSHGVPQVEALW